MIDPEVSVVGSLCIDARCLPEISGLVSPEDFALGVNRAIYKAALELDRDGIPIDPVSLLDRCAKNETPVSRQYLFECMEGTGTAANAGLYASLVREGAIRRDILGLCDQVAEKATNGADVGELFTDLSDGLQHIERRDTAAELQTAQDSIVELMEYRNGVEQGKSKTFIPTGLTPLDKMLGGGLLSGGLYILGARPGVGKTTLALWITDAVARTSGAVLFISLEMSTLQITTKRMARETSLPYSQLLMGKMSESEYNLLAQGSVRLAKLPVTVNKRPGATVADIGRMARRVPQIVLVVVDYLGLVRPATGKNSKYEAVTQVSNDLKQLALALGVPILALSQLNRENMQRQDKRPTLADLRDSGAIEQDADGVLLLHREDYYSMESSEAGSASLMECILAKNRHGRTGTTQISVFADTGKIFPVEWRRDQPFTELPANTQTPWPD